VPSDRPGSERGITTDLADPGYRMRLGIAFAVALALHEIVAGLWPTPLPPEHVQERVAQEIVTISKRVPAPSPSPVPTPSMTPAPRYTLAPRFEVRAPAARAAATPHAAIGGAAARKHLVLVKPKPVAPKPPESLVAGTHLGKQNGGSGTGAGAGNGTSGLAGSGSGNGTAGTGNGANSNSAPCGEVLLLPGRVDYRPDGTVLQHVYAKVIMRDGDVELGVFPYPFIYAAERLNPFVHDDQLAADKGIPVQTPPPGSDVSTMPATVQVVLKYTSAATGFTTLPDCGATQPSQGQAPSP
jgi:hypothetical protein